MSEEGLQFIFPDDPKQPVSLRKDLNESVYKAILENIVTPVTSTKEVFKPAVEVYLDEFFINKRKVFNVSLILHNSNFIVCSK